MDKEGEITTNQTLLQLLKLEAHKVSHECLCTFLRGKGLDQKGSILYLGILDGGFSFALF